MATQQTAYVNITNNTDGHAWIQLFHQNSSNDQQSAMWLASPGETVGPLSVNFETGYGSYTVTDYWCVILRVQDGSSPGTYINTGGIGDPQWYKECQLQDTDAGQTLTFSVSTTTFDINEERGETSDSMVYMGPGSPITNVFVVMLENHSFDNMFAMSGISGLTAATTANSNSYNSTTYNVANGAPLSMPTDPGHEFPDVVEQLAGQGASYLSGGAYPAISNSGFASNYATTTSEGPTPPASDIGDIMCCYTTSTQLPVAYLLATNFAICDHWFSSLPGPTWPNRFFLHGASSSGLDHSPTPDEIAEWEAMGFTYPNGSIYQAMNKANISYRFYADKDNQFSDDPQNGSSLGAIPQVSALDGVSIWDIHNLATFTDDLQNPYPYPYTFIEPNYGDISTNYEGGSSQHPMDDVYGGEGFISYIYETIRNSPIWNTSLLIITYDEHGGFYDSVAPGPAVAPDDGSSSTYNQYGFNFQQYGVRVPAIVVSPLISAGTIDHTVYDHTSVLATIENLFRMAPLTQRDANANTLNHLLSLSSARTDCPTKLTPPSVSMKKQRQVLSPEALAAKMAEPIPQSGNLPGFLHIMMKTDYELSGRTEADKKAAIERFKQVKTRGQAKDYILQVQSKVASMRTSIK